MDEAFNSSTFSKDKARLVEHQIARELLVKVLE
jgi:hypothetical protein